MHLTRALRTDWGTVAGVHRQGKTSEKLCALARGRL